MEAWTYVVVTFDQSTGLSRFYINGEFSVQRTFSQEDPLIWNTMYIGWLPDYMLPKMGYTYLGGMDEFRIYNYALDEETIYGLYQGYLGVTLPPQ